MNRQRDTCAGANELRCLFDSVSVIFTAPRMLSGAINRLYRQFIGYREPYRDRAVCLHVAHYKVFSNMKIYCPVLDFTTPT